LGPVVPSLGALRLSAHLVPAAKKESAVTDTLDLVSVLGPALAARIGQERYRLWFADKTHFRLDGPVLVVGGSNRFCQEWLQNKFVPEVTEAAREALQSPVAVKFVIDPTLFQASRRQQEQAVKAPSVAIGKIPITSTEPKGSTVPKSAKSAHDPVSVA